MCWPIHSFIHVCYGSVKWLCRLVTIVATCRRQPRRHLYSHAHTHTHMRARKQHHCHRPSTSETPSELPNNKCRYRHCCGATVISGLFEESSRNTKEQHSQQQQQQHTQLTSLFTYSAVCIYMELRALPPVSRTAGAKRVLGWRVTAAAVHAS